MKIHPLIAGAIVTAVFTLQGWILYEVVQMKVEFATFKAQISYLAKTP